MVYYGKNDSNTHKLWITIWTLDKEGLKFLSFWSLFCLKKIQDSLDHEFVSLSNFIKRYLALCWNFLTICLGLDARNPFCHFSTLLFPRLRGSGGLTLSSLSYKRRFQPSSLLDIAPISKLKNSLFSTNRSEESFALMLSMRATTKSRNRSGRIFQTYSVLVSAKQFFHWYSL